MLEAVAVEVVAVGDGLGVLALQVGDQPGEVGVGMVPLLVADQAGGERLGEVGEAFDDAVEGLGSEVAFGEELLLAESERRCIGRSPRKGCSLEGYSTSRLDRSQVNSDSRTSPGHENDRLPADFDRFPGPGQPEAGRPRLRAAEAVRHRPLRRGASLVPQGPDQRRIEELLGELAAGDRLVVSELSRLGRSLSQVIQIVDELVKRKVRFIAIKEAIRFEGKQDMQTKVMVALFGLFAEVERDLISERTKEGLAAARAKGRLLGRPKGSLGTSKLDGKEGEIRMLLEKEVSKAVDRQDRGRVVDQPPSLHPDPKTRPEAPKGLGKPGTRAASLEDIFAAIWAVPSVGVRKRRPERIVQALRHRPLRDGRPSGRSPGRRGRRQACSRSRLTSPDEARHADAATPVHRAGDDGRGGCRGVRVRRRGHPRAAEGL